MASLNRVEIIGRLGKDPEVRYSQSGNAVCNMTVATDESYTDREGNKVDRTEWHTVVCYQKQAENCGQYLKKGSLVFVEGSLQTRKWKDKQEQDRYTTEIKAQRVQFLDRKGDAPREAGGGGRGYEEDYGAPAAAPRGNAPRGGQTGGARQQPQGGGQANRRGMDEELGPAFPSEASNMDDVPF